MYDFAIIGGGLERLAVELRHLQRNEVGEAYEGLGEMTNAARAYLESFSGDATGPVAPMALFKLGFALGQIGQTQDACITLAEVGVRFPGNPAVTDAQTAMRNLGCS